RNVRGSSPSTSVVPLSNQVTTLNHKRFKGFKMFSDGHLEPILRARNCKQRRIRFRAKTRTPPEGVGRGLGNPHARDLGRLEGSVRKTHGRARGSSSERPARSY